MTSKFGETHARLQRIQNKCIKMISSTNTCERPDYTSLKLMPLNTFMNISRSVDF